MIDLIGCKIGERFINSLGQIVEVVGFDGEPVWRYRDFRILYQRVSGWLLSGNSIPMHPDQFYKNYSKRIT